VAVADPADRAKTGHVTTASEGHLSTGLPYLKLGTGPPLVVASGLTAEHTNPTGSWRKRALSWAQPFAEHFTVYLVNRRPGLPPDVTLSDIAGDYAGAIEHDLGGSAHVHGTSTGGSVVLQLAIDRPELVERLVVCASACTLASRGKAVQREVARLAERGEGRRAAATMIEFLFPERLKRAGRGFGWLIGGSFAADDPTDMVRTIIAEDAFDAEPDLGRITAPTLVIGGADDPFYSVELFERTAAGIPDGRAVVVPGKSHMYVAASKETAALALGFLLAG
jgi:pimeloyl-ACP methyl ester carboxylesterase